MAAGLTLLCRLRWRYHWGLGIGHQNPELWTYLVEFRQIHQSQHFYPHQLVLAVPASNWINQELPK